MSPTSLAMTKVVTSVAAVVHDHRIEDRMGREIVTALRAADVLVPAGEADSYPCDGGGEACPRTVFRNQFRGSTEPPFAMCRSYDCPNLRLASEHLLSSTVRSERLACLLQELLGLAQSAPMRDALVDRAWHLGLLPFGRETRPVMALIQPPSLKLAASLLSLRQRYRQPLAILFTSDTVAPEVVRRYLPGSDLELVLLEHRLSLEQGVLQWVEPGSIGRALTPHATEAAEPYAQAFNGTNREINRAEYDALLADAEQHLDLVLDRTRGEGQVCRVGTRGPDGRLRYTELSGEEGLALDRLVRRGEPMRASELRDVAGHHFRWVSRLRKKVDRPLEPHRYKWHLIQTLGGREKSQEFAFQPVGRCRFVLLSRVEAAT